MLLVLVGQIRLFLAGWIPLFMADPDPGILLLRGSDPNFPDVYLDVAHDMHVVGASVHLSVRHDVYACNNIHWDILYMMFIIYRVS